MQENVHNRKRGFPIQTRILCFLLLFLVLWISSVCAEKNSARSPEVIDFSGLGGKTVSMLNGAPFEELIRMNAPDVGSFSYFTNTTDMLLALKAKKTDAVLLNNAIAQLVINRNPELALFPQSLQDSMFGFAFAKGDPERDAWQSAFSAISETEKHAVWEKWTGADDSRKMLPVQDWPGLNGTVEVAACDTLEPMSYAGEGGEVMGFDIEMILRMAKKLDVHVHVSGMEFSAVMSSVQAGKAKIGVGSIIATAERKESVDFVEYYPAAFVLVVRSAQTEKRPQGSFTCFADLEHARIGVTTGSLQVLQAEERFPDAELFYFTTDVDMLNALRTHKIDAFASSEVLVKTLMKENADLIVLDEWLGDKMKAAAIFPKTESGQALCDQFSTFIRAIRQNGVYEEIQEIWFGEDEEKQTVPDLHNLPGTNGTLRMAIDPSMVPFAYIKDGNPAGADIDSAVRFCKEYGYGLEIVPMDFSGIIPSVVTGKVDFACSGIAYTAERAESVLFSEPTYESGSVLAVLKTDETAVPAAEDSSLWSSIVSSFDKTFIREDRWLLFVDGVMTTLLITVLSILFGTALGFGIFMLCRNGNRAADSVTRFSLGLVQGMPMVVLLMILYYIIFGSVAVSGILVSVIGFTLTFGAAVYGLLKMGVGTIDRGQYEAAYALGYPNRRTFFRIILPQVIPLLLPAYKGEIVGLIKATAIVGYIAVQDLTKMGDIVRSRTYEAFFPLIAVTVIYFILEGLLGFLVSRIQVRTNPKKRSQKTILKGVNVR